jgi:hypothetical protein
MLCLDLPIPRRNYLRKLLLSLAELPNDVKATMIKRFVFAQRILFQKEWDYARVFIEILAVK